ncbi:MAG: hypothetical protein AB2A00_32325 [Myxococcota bacterium]
MDTRIAVLLMGLTTSALAAEAQMPAGPSNYQYAAAAVDAPPSATPAQILVTWHALMVERNLSPDVVDHREQLALGDWLNRPHVCNGRVRYHVVVGVGRALRAIVVAECYGTAVGLERAALGLAEELGKRIQSKGTAGAMPVQEVPQRIWQARLWRGNTTPSLNNEPPPATPPK